MRRGLSGKSKNSVIFSPFASYVFTAEVFLWFAVCRICAAIVRDEQSIMPVSSLMQGEYGLEDVVLSIPAVVEANGSETVDPIDLREKELAQLKSSAEILKKIIKENS